MPQVTAKIENADNIDVTLRITLPLREWKALRDQMGNEWPAWKLGGKIRETISKVESVIYGPADD